MYLVRADALTGVAFGEFRHRRNVRAGSPRPEAVVSVIRDPQPYLAGHRKEDG